MSTTTVRLSPTGLIESIPWQFGHEPVDAWVIVLLDEGRVSLHMRVDRDGLADALPVLRRRCDRGSHVVISAWSAQGIEDAGMTKGSEILSRFFREAGLAILVDVQVTPAYIIGMGAGEVICQPRDPGEADAMAVQYIERGQYVHASRAERVASFSADADAHLIPDEHADMATVRAAWREYVLTDSHRVQDLTPAQLGTLAAIGRDKSERDAIIALVVPMDDSPSPAHDPETIARLHAITRRLPDEVGVVDVLAVLASWLYLRLGDGLAARAVIERALRIDPEHRLTLLLAHLVALGIEPPRGR